MIPSDRVQLRHARRRVHMENVGLERVLDLCRAVEEFLELEPETWIDRPAWREAVRAIRVDFEPFTFERNKWAHEPQRQPGVAP